MCQRFGTEITLGMKKQTEPWLYDVILNQRLARSESDHSGDWSKVCIELIYPTPGPIENVGSLLANIHVEREVLKVMSKIRIFCKRCFLGVLR